MSALRLSAVFIGVLLASPSAFALLTPTETEWVTWPDYCRARFVVSGDGRSSSYVSRVPRAETTKFEAQLGANVWHWLHHYCAGLIYMSRAKNETDPRSARYLQETAQRQFAGQYQRVPPRDPFFPELVTTMARLYRDMGDEQEALKLLREGIGAHPTYPSTYAFASLILRDNGHVQQAKDILLAGNHATGGESAEIHYFLGMLYADSGDLDSAVDHAVQAYKLGYPLPGLRVKLRRLGRSIE